jgi:hypothetical protein
MSDHIPSKTSDERVQRWLDSWGERLIPKAAVAEFLRATLNAHETRAFPQPGQDPLCEVHHFLMGDGRCSCKTVRIDGMPDYVQRISDCIVGADVGGLTMDWAHVLFDLKELAQRRELS